jgi:hypothetical protein
MTALSEVVGGRDLIISKVGNPCVFFICSTVVNLKNAKK